MQMIHLLEVLPELKVVAVEVCGTIVFVVSVSVAAVRKIRSVFNSNE